MNLEKIAGVAHEPAGAPKGIVVLTHGAGGSRDSKLLQQVCDEWARHGWLAVRYNLPYRRRRPTGPPSGSAATDRAGIVEAIDMCRGLADGPLIVGGHSYGGRQTSMVVAASPEGVAAQVDVLTLFSYPVHPPGKPERPRTEHLPDITVPTMFTHGTSDPFGTLAEVRAAAAMISAPTEVVEITGARHDLGSKTLDVAGLAVDAALRLLALRDAKQRELHQLSHARPDGVPRNLPRRRNLD
jgi:predicted alpha/beta-hydrolase family hydrolase